MKPKSARRLRFLLPPRDRRGRGPAAPPTSAGATRFEYNSAREGPEGEKDDGTSVDAGNGGGQARRPRLDLGDWSGRPGGPRPTPPPSAARARGLPRPGLDRNGVLPWLTGVEGGMTLDPNPAGVMTRGHHRTPPGAADASAAPAVPDDLHALRAVVEGTAAGTGREFFRSMSRHLSDAIGVHSAGSSQ